MSRPPSLTQHRGAGYDLQKAQDYVQRAVAPLIVSDILHGVLLTFEIDPTTKRRTEGLFFTAATSKRIPHLLKRRPNGWIVARDFGANKNQLIENASETDATYLTLASAVDCGVFLWVF